ncbi:MAG: hypothetical protein HQL31_04250 [Planctomycetes bacterium]|nr:hypothetical protein [Planctomycetota bacterium]
MNTLTPPRVGLLPFYLKLYDDLMPESRAGFDAFLQRIMEGFRARGIEVVCAPACRVESEFKAALLDFENQVDAVVSLHLAYSPSLESIDAFVQSEVPLILLDTTMDEDFGLSVPASRIMFNHGVHGVMDFACMLRRRKRPFEIVAGHERNPRLLDRAAALVRAVIAAREFRGSRALRVGPASEGMGDFSVDASLLRRHFGIEVSEVGIDALDEAIAKVSESAVEEEMASDRSRFDCELSKEAHRYSTRVGLGLRRLIDDGGYGAMSVNFQAFDSAERPACAMPFLEISKSMARGIGYGGEGDVLTATLVGSLARAFEAVTFTEIFCADWAGNALFLSHMGEISPSVAAGRPRVIAKPFFSGGSRDPAQLVCAVKPGPAVLVNLAPGPDDTFTLIAAPVEVMAEGDSLDPAMRNAIRAWVRPQLGVVDFLEAYSKAGGTHHSALVLGGHTEAVIALGRRLGIGVLRIG